ncbi:MAG: hypothetical protein KF813_04555 [Trueperaceae bacterium]|nr:hypothetical protein [Trueperaceae bacterium]
MHKHRLLAAVIALSLFCVSSAQPRSGAGLELAVSFVPKAAEIAYLSNWSGVIDDLRRVYPIEPVVGDNDFLRALSDRHAAAAQFAVSGRSPWFMHEMWAWSLLDLDWELQVYPGGAVLAFNSGFDPGPTLALLDERGYQASDHHGQVTRHIAFDLSLAWLRPPLAEYTNVAYLEQERVLVVASTLEALHALLDAQAGRSEAWSAADIGLAVAGAAEPPLGAWVFPAATACRYMLVDEPGLQAYSAAAIAYHRVGDEIVGTAVLAYDSEVAPALDLEARTSFATDDESAFRSGDYFQSLTAEIVGEMLWLRFGELDRSSRMFDMFNRSALPFLRCTG